MRSRFVIFAIFTAVILGIATGAINVSIGIQKPGGSCYSVKAFEDKTAPLHFVWRAEWTEPGGVWVGIMFSDDYTQWIATRADMSSNTWCIMGEHLR